MRKSLLALLTMLLAVTKVSASTIAEVTFPLTDQESVSAYSCNWTGKDAAGRTWRFVNFNNNKNDWAFIRCGWKTQATTSVISSPLISETVAKYVIKVTKSSNVTSAKLEVLKSDSTTIVETKDVTLATGNVEVSLTGTANAYYRLTIENEKVSSNGTTEIAGLTLTSTDEFVKKEANLKWSAGSATVIVGSEYTSPTFTYSTTAPITFTTSDPDVATVSNEGVVSLATDEGTAIITATSTENDDYKAGTATYTLTVCHNKYYSKVTSIESGAKYLIVAQRNDSTLYAQPLAASKTYGYMSASVIKELKDEISVKSAYDDEFIITASGNGYTIQTNDGRYYYQSGTYNSFNVGSDAKVWTIEPQNDRTFKISMNGYYLCWGMGTYKTFAAYTELNNAVNPMLYKYTGITPTGINNVAATPATENTPAYNIAGQRVNASAKGIIIKGGRKYINR